MLRLGLKSGLSGHGSTHFSSSILEARSNYEVSSRPPGLHSETHYIVRPSQNGGKKSGLSDSQESKLLFRETT